MDGLAVTVVPKHRAGMATGIFNTDRVAGEGVTPAIVSAVLAALAHTSLIKLLPSDGSVTAAEISEASQRIATGDVLGAAHMLPQLAKDALTIAYSDAFQVLVHVLTGVTVFAAIAAFGFLGKTMLLMMKMSLAQMYRNP